MQPLFRETSSWWRNYCQFYDCCNLQIILNTKMRTYVRAIFLLAKHFALLDCFIFVFCNPFSSFGSCCKTRNMIRMAAIKSSTFFISTRANRSQWASEESVVIASVHRKRSLWYKKENVDLKPIKIKNCNILT